MEGSSRSPIHRLRSSFSLKLLLLFLSVFVVIAAIGGVVYAQTGDTLEQDTQERMTQFTKLQANTTAEWVERMRDRAQFVAASNEVATGSEEAIAERLREAREDAPPSVTDVHYVDLDDGTVIASSNPGVGSQAYRGEGVEWIEDGVDYDYDDETAVTYPYEDPVTGEPAIAFVSEAEDGDGAVVLVVDLATRSEEFERPGTSNASFTHIVDDRGTVVMSHDPHQLFTQNMGPEDEHSVNSMGVERGLQGETDYVEMDMGHHGEMAMGFTRVEGTPWVIMTHVPVDEAYALQDSVLAGIGALLLVALLGLAGVGLVVGRNTTGAVQELAEQAHRLEEGDLDAEFETDRVDEIGQLYYAFDAMRISLRERLRDLEEARERIARTNDHLETKADEYSRVMRTCAEGDLTQRMDPESESEAMTEIATEFNRMVSELERTSEQLGAFAANVAASSQEVNASAEEVRSASEQVTESIQEISEGAERQHEQLREVNEEMSNLSTATQQIAATTNQVADLAEETAAAARNGRDAAEDAIEGMDEIAEESASTVEVIAALEEEVEQIDELAESIGELAEQTNMLALNASIEASRTTETDEGGFSVVADEVQELADQTKEASETIEQRIEAIKAGTDDAVDEVEETSDRIEQHRSAVEQTVDSLEEISDYAEETSDGVEEISAATQQQAASTQEVVAMVDEVTAISEETTAETENVAAAGEEQTTSLTEVTHAIQDLSERANQLSAELDEIETDADVDPDRPFGPEPADDAVEAAGDGGSTDAARSPEPEQD